jgi:hypothetical protein
VRATPPPPPTASASVRIQGPRLGAGVTVISPQCTGGEVCGDGLDNNCNGVIDEGCGYHTGNIQVTLAWDGGADLDLYVTDPTGETVSYRNRNSRTGGALDIDARGACGRGESAYTVENVYWTNAPPSGQYLVEVHNYSACRSGDPTRAVVSIAVDGQLLGSYNLLAYQGQRQPVAYFQIP